MEERNQQTKINHHSRCRPDLKVLSTGAVDKKGHDSINLRLQPSPQIYTPPIHIYEPLTIIYEPPVDIPPPVIIEP